MVRFGRWDDILAEPEPPEHLPMTRSVWHYARGVALAATGRVKQARQEYEAFRVAREAVPESRLLFNNQVSNVDFDWYLRAV